MVKTRFYDSANAICLWYKCCYLYFQLPARHRVMKLVCANNCNDCTIYYSGKEDYISFLSKETACAHELGFDFTFHMLELKGNFQRFCLFMNRQYSHSYNDSSFLSPGTFEKCFFFWSSSQDIDFRESGDPFCGIHPDHLVCDSTHLGVSAKHLDVTPIFKADVEECTVSSHLRYDRVFLPYNNQPQKDDIIEARRDLHSLCLFYTAMEGERLSFQAVANILHCLPDDANCVDFLSKFIDDEFPVLVRQTAAELLSLLLRDAPVSTVLPHAMIPEILAKLDMLKTNEISVYSILPFLSSIGPEVEHILVEASSSPFLHCICNFLIFLCQFVFRVHENDPPCAPAIPIEGTYNPESGVCYYFTPHGNQVRHLPSYKINLKYKEACTKNSKEPKHGWGYLFLWMCSKHGHCLGFHLISGAEGRRDPFSSAVKYMEQAPKHIYYDFGCALNDYCLNREPAFFRDTRFWIDRFHSYNHVCGLNHKPKRVDGVCHHDTSIAEQINSFLSNFRYFLDHLTQSHFTYFAQLFIKHWNDKKTLKYQAELEGAANIMM